MAGEDEGPGSAVAENPDDVAAVIAELEEEMRRPPDGWNLRRRP